MLTPNRDAMLTDETDRSLADKSAFDAYYGLNMVQCSGEEVKATLTIRPELLQPTGVVHGGVYASMAEAMASSGTNWAVTAGGEVGLGMSNNTSFLRSASSGILSAEARPRHRGATTWVWDVEIYDEARRLCAVSRVTIAVRRVRGA